MNEKLRLSQPTTPAAEPKELEKVKLEEFVYPEEKIAVFIDGQSTHKVARSSIMQIDYLYLYQSFFVAARLTAIKYFGVAFPDEDGNSPLQKLADYLAYNNYHSIVKTGTTSIGQHGQKICHDREYSGSIIADFIVAAMELIDAIDHYVLFTGDDHFIPLIEALTRRGKRVTVINSKAVASTQFRRVAPVFLELITLEDEIGREPMPKPLERPKDDDDDDGDDESGEEAIAA